MTDKPENPQAFPELERIKVGDVEQVKVVEKGMTLRDYAAIEIAAGIMSNTDTIEAFDGELKDRTNIAAVVSETAYIFADAMLKARAE